MEDEVKFFIYVSHEEDKEKLLERGYTLLRSNPSGTMYIFIDDKDNPYGLDGISYARGDILLF